MEITGTMTLSQDDIEILMEQVRPLVLEEFMEGKFRGDEITKYLGEVTISRFFDIVEEAVGTQEHKMHSEHFVSNLDKKKIEILKNVLSL